MKIRNNTYKYFLFAFGISIFCYWRWFFDFSILSSGDWGFLFTETQKEFLSLNRMWLARGFGDFNLSLSQFPINLLWGISAHFFNFALSERILFHWPAILFSVIGSFFLVKRVTRSDIGALVGSFVFTFNTYFLVGRTTSLTLQVAYSLCPLFFLFFIQFLEIRRKRDFFLSLLFGLLISFYEFRVFYIISILLFFYFFYFFFVIESEKKDRWEKVFSTGLLYLCIFLINLFWLYPIANIGAIASNDLFNRSLFGNGFFDITRSFTLFHPFWTFGKIDWFVVQKVPLHFWSIPIIAILGLVLNRKNKQVVFFGLTAFIGILLAKQSGEPFISLYKWLYEHFPGFSAFREASKFYFLIALGYSVLIGAFAAWVSENWVNSKVKIISKYIVLGLLALLFLWNGKSLITGDIERMFEGRTVPHDYFIVKDFLLKQPEFFRTFWLPTDSKWSFYSNAKPKVSAISALQGKWKDYTAFDTQYANLLVQEKIIEIFQKPWSKKLFDSASIKYVFVPLRDFQNDDDFFLQYGARMDEDIRDWYIERLDNVDWLKRVDIGTSQVVVFENVNFLPHIHSAAQVNFVLSNNTEFPSVETGESIYGTMQSFEQYPFFAEALDNIVIPVEADREEIQKRLRTISLEIDPVRAKSSKAEFDFYLAGYFLKDFRLHIPIDGDYDIFLRKSSIIGNNKRVELKVGSVSITQKFSQRKFLESEEWKFFNTVQMKSGDYSFEAYENAVKMELLAGQDIVFVAKQEKNFSVPLVEFRQINTGKYEVAIRGARESFPLVFSESYHPRWNLFVLDNKSAPLDILKATPSLSENHFKINNFANAWWVDLKKLEDQGAIVKSGDGTYSFTFILEFTSHKHFYEGLVVSLCTLGVFVIFALYKLFIFLYTKFKR